MDKETANVGRIKPRYSYFALVVKSFRTKWKGPTSSDMVNPLLANTRLLEVNKPLNESLEENGDSFECN